MATIDLVVKASKETHDVGVLIKKLVLALKAKKPLVQVAAEELKSLSDAVSGIDELDDEAKADLVASISAIYVPISEMARELLVKPATEAAPSGN